MRPIQRTSVWQSGRTAAPGDMHAKRAESECNMEQDFDWEDSGEGIVGYVKHEGVVYRGRGNNWWSSGRTASDQLADELNKAWTKWFIASNQRSEGHAETL